MKASRENQIKLTYNSISEKVKLNRKRVQTIKTIRSDSMTQIKKHAEYCGINKMGEEK